MELVNVIYQGQGVEAQQYNNSDLTLITNNYINTSFLSNSNDYIEAFIYDDNNNLLNSDYNYTSYKLPSQASTNNGSYGNIILDPQSYAMGLGFDRGSINVQYNFVRNLFNSSYGNFYWIKQISPSRKELILSSQTISDSDILRGFNNYQTYASNKSYFADFYLNFGNNQYIIAVNVAYSTDSNGANLLIKLYEPLPLDFDVKSTLWIVDQIAQSVSYNVNIQIEAEPVINNNALRGPNFKIDVNQKVGLTTPYYNYNNLIASPITASLNQLNSYYQDKSININVDYTNFSNFIHFSSATERLNNFTYKLGLIESYTSQINAQQSVVGGNLVASSSIGFLSQSISNIIKNFDNYEYYLYYTSASFAWPKINNTQPYQQASVNSTAGLNWLGSANTLPSTNGVSMLYSASYYDATNKDMLINTIPQYLLDDPNNMPYETFVHMIGQHFDNIWVYYKDVTNKYNNTNNPNTGISLDLVGDALKGLGISLYTNSNLSDNLYYSLFGINADGSLLPPTGSERITNYVTSGIATLPAQTIQNEIYKRIYHNLPYLLKTKGTHRGLKALIACFGIPENVLSVNEFGGYDKRLQDGLLEVNNRKTYAVTSSLLISSSVLSPYTTLQYNQTNRRPDLPKIEVGFSPSDSINAYITGSLGYFNIDQLIGNPTDAYSSSYQNLDNLKKSVFSNATYQHSVWEYLRMIKFYNNSLFKMIKDFVPARADVSTGIIVKPHILERSKYARHEPVAIDSSKALSSEISGSRITGSNALDLKASTSYVKTEYTRKGLIPVSKSLGFEKFTGEFGGSSFVGTNRNKSQIEKSYQPFQKSITYTPSQSINLGALYQNVTGSVKSTMFYRLDFSGVSKNSATNYGLITQSIALGSSYRNNPNSQLASVQDYNYNLRRSVISKYSGSYSRAAAYNVYTTASSTYAGDVTYGNDPMIAYYTNKLGLFTQLETSSYIPGQINASLAYLVDVSGGLQELNQNNTHWTDVQNIFKGGNTLTIKQFDNKKYNNQKTTDGVKTIYSSGYSYSPQLYFLTGADNALYFNNTGNAIITGFVAQNDYSINSYISGASNPSFPVSITNSTTRTGNIYNIYTVSSGGSSGNLGYYFGVANQFPTYSAQASTQYTFTTQFTLNLQFQDPQLQSGNIDSGSFLYQIIGPNGAILPGSTQQIMDFTSSYTAAVSTPNTLTASGILQGNESNFSKVGADITFNTPLSVYKNGTSHFYNSGGSSITLAYWSWYSPSYGGTQFGGLASLSNVTEIQDYNGYTTPPFGTTIIYNPVAASNTPASSTYNKSFNISYTTPATYLSKNDKVSFQLIQRSMSTSNYTASFSGVSSLALGSVSVGAGGYPYATSSQGNFINSVANGYIAASNSPTGSIILSSNLSSYLGYQFVPYFISGSTVYSSSLYAGSSTTASYGDTSYVFQPTLGDKIVMSDYSGISQTFDVIGYSIDGNSRVNISVVPTILSNWIANPSLIYQFLLVKKYKDEQSLQLTFNKKAGQTSYGFIIPQNINPTVLANINSIQSQVQAQLLSNQANTGQ